MNIAAQLNGNDLILFCEGATWKKTTLPFNQEKVNVELVVFITDGGHVFYEAKSKSAPSIPTSLAFCKETITVEEFKRKLKKGGFGEPYEIRLASDRFEIRKEFLGAFTIIFRQYEQNPVFAQWLIKSLPLLEVAKMMQRLKNGRRYYTSNFIEYAEFNTIERFISYRLDIWHKAVVKEFEATIEKGQNNSVL